MASRPGNVPAGNRSKVATMKTTRTKVKTVVKEEEDSIPAVRNEDFIKDEDVNLAPTEASIENMRTKLRGFAFKSATDVNTSSRSRRNASAVTSASALVKTEDVSGTGNGTNNSNGIEHSNGTPSKTPRKRKRSPSPKIEEDTDSTFNPNHAIESKPTVKAAASRKSKMPKKVKKEPTSGPSNLTSVDQPVKSEPGAPPLKQNPSVTPLNWEITYRLIEEMRKGKNAPVDTMGCHTPMLEIHIDPKTRRFITLVSLMLSSQTKDEVTSAAVQNLRRELRHVAEDQGSKANLNVKAEPEEDVKGLANYKEYLTPQVLIATPISLIESCINKVGFWRRKAVYLQSAAKILHEQYDDDIPNTIEGLCALPGVGMKMAVLTMQAAWGDSSVGVGVDTHVHRISNRLGWHGRWTGSSTANGAGHDKMGSWRKTETKTPEETRLSLEAWLPLQYYADINPLLVGFGQTICQPVKTKCEECLLSRKNLSNLDLPHINGLAQVVGPLCPSAFKSSGSPTKVKVKTKVEVETMAGGPKLEIALEESVQVKEE